MTSAIIEHDRLTKIFGEQVSTVNCGEGDFQYILNEGFGVIDQYIQGHKICFL